MHGAQHSLRLSYPGLTATRTVYATEHGNAPMLHIGLPALEQMCARKRVHAVERGIVRES